MSEIKYPTRSIIESWVQYLREQNNVLRVSLPHTDEDWYEHVLGAIERVEHSYSPNTLHRRAAELFYNINKAHNYIDGNKRTSILMVYLFYVLNGRVIVNTLDIRDLAKRVAKSHGRGKHDTWIEKLEKAFEICTEPFRI